MTEYFKHHKNESGINFLVFGHTDKTVNTLGEGPLRELNALLDSIQEDNEAKGLIIKSSKKDFIVGADIKEIESLGSIEATKDACQKMQEILSKIENLKIPTVAEINGQCLGGGLELALACDWRVADESAKLGLPEIQLGLIPGAGGTQRLPRLIGIQAGLDLILTGKTVKAKKAAKIGLIDSFVHPSSLSKCSDKFVQKKRINKYKQKSQNLGDNLTKLAIEQNPIGRKVMEKKAREMVDKQSKGFYPAPHKAISAVFDGFDKKISQGLDIEAKYFAELSQTKESKSLIHLFHATTKAKKNLFKNDKDALQAPNIVGVIGSGFMGAGIATVLADKGVFTRVSDPNTESTTRALQGAHKYFKNKLKKKRIQSFELEQKMAHISPNTDTTGFEQANVIIEAVFEDLDLKKKILSDIENKCDSKTVFASNTSALPIKDIAEDSKHPERVLGMHFFSPVEKMPLLEIVKTEKTADWAVSEAFELGQKMGKQIIVVNDKPGFYTTRALAFFMAEAAAILSEGSRIEKIDKALTDFGFPVGPITLMDEVGIDVGSHVLDTMKSSFNDRVTIPSGLESIKNSGRLGRKNSKGFYEYHNGKKGDPDTSIYNLLDNWKENNLPQDEIIDRCVLTFVNESIRCLEENVLESAVDGDIGAIFGLGFPPFWGGPFKYVDHIGANVIVDRLNALTDKYGTRFKPCDLLQKHANNNSLFFSN